MTNPLIYDLYHAPGFKPQVGVQMSSYKDAEVFLQQLTVEGGGEFTVTEEQVEDQIYYRKTIKNQLQVGRPDFDLLYNELDDCVKYWVKIYKMCDGVKTFLYRTYFNMNNVTFDVDNCRAEIDLQYASLYDCISENRSNIQNLYLEESFEKFTFALDPILPSSFTFADLRRVTEQLIGGMDCAGYENDQLYSAWFPISDFFNWQRDLFLGPNAPLTASLIENYVLAGSVGPLTPIPNYVNIGADVYNIGIALKTNMVDPAASNPGTTFTLSFADIEKILKDVFNVYWCLVPNETSTQTSGMSGPFQVANYIRFEHYSWFLKSVNYNAIDSTNFPMNRGKNKFAVNSNDYPFSEEWTFQDSIEDDFVGFPIIYGTCIGENKKIKRENLNFTLDGDNLINNPTYPFNTDGFFLVDIEVVDAGPSPGLYWKTATGYLSGNVIFNGRLSTANFQYDLHRYNRPALQGEMNGIPNEPFLSPVYKKEQSNIVVKSCCDDPFDPLYSLVKTEMGDGIITEKENNYSTGIITFQLNQQ